MSGKDDTTSPDRRERLGAALRANLRRRKAQARARNETRSPDRQNHPADQGGDED